jgi:putative hemolysin
MVVVEIIIVLMLFLLNGFFAMAEFAIVSSRRVRLERLAQEGHEGARAALALIDDPARMLAAVQVGFTTTATIAGIFSGATLADRLGDAVAAYGKPVAIFAVTIAVTYAALIIGELVPKQIALSNPESIAVRVAQLLSSVAKVAAPVVWLLNASTRLLLRLLRVRPRLERTVTEEDIHLLVAEGARLGVIHNVERDMIEGVLNLADSPIRTIMTPRPRVQWVDLDGSNDDILSTIRACPHAQLLACRGSLDELVGVVRKQDLLGSTGNSPTSARQPESPWSFPKRRRSSARSICSARPRSTPPWWWMSSATCRALSPAQICWRRSRVTSRRSMRPRGRG